LARGGQQRLNANGGGPKARLTERVGAAGLLAAGVLAIHAWLLAELTAPPGWLERRSFSAAAPAMQVRQWTLPGPVSAETRLSLQAPAAVAAMPSAPPGAKPITTPVASPVGKPTAAGTEDLALAPAVRRLAAAPSEPSVPAAAPAAPAAAAPVAAAEPLPVYATRLPPAAWLQFAVKRAGVARSGVQAELRWQPDDAGRYALSLGLGAAGWASVGAHDDGGLAPERQVETRRGRELRAVNFQRESGRITFSGPAVEYPLLPGAQDRLSWMLQLAGVLSADPERGRSGEVVALFVVGVRGDATVWTFISSGPEDIEVPAGAVRGALHLRREPEQPYDSRVDVWLDPARHFLPARLRMQSRTDGESVDFQLLRSSFP
jgi:hypothetical protein